MPGYNDLPSDSRDDLHRPRGRTLWPAVDFISGLFKSSKPKEMAKTPRNTISSFVKDLDADPARTRGNYPISAYAANIQKALDIGALTPEKHEEIKKREKAHWDSLKK
jgi:hypothetical protein